MDTTRLLLTCVAALGAGAAGFAAEVPPPERQIAIAVQAAPEEFRADATVLGYDGAGALVTLRQGGNDIVCLAHPPGDPGVRVACYAKSLEPFMRRGRELKAQGVPDEERTKRRFKEAEEGTLMMPAAPATLYVLSGAGVDPATGEVTEPYRRYVVYTPGATSASTGLSEKPVGPGAPWIMFPGTPGAHIMINPPKDAPAQAPAPAAAPAAPPPPTRP
jgi:hypothetical protein